MTIDARVEADILDWIGDVEDDEQPIEVVYALRGTVEATALSILRRRRATLGPDSWSLSGDYSESDGGRRAAWLDRQIRSLQAIVGISDVADVAAVGTVTRVRQPDR